MFTVLGDQAYATLLGHEDYPNALSSTGTERDTLQRNASSLRAEASADHYLARHGKAEGEQGLTKRKPLPDHRIATAGGVGRAAGAHRGEDRSPRRLARPFVANEKAQVPHGLRE
jgi:hypothetical protein